MQNTPLPNQPLSFRLSLLLKFIGALLYDCVLATALVIVIWLPIGSIDAYFSEVENATWTQSIFFDWLKTAILLAILALYFVSSISKIGQTVGMRAWRIKLCSQKNTEQIPAFSRQFALYHCLISLVLLPLFFTVLFDKKGLSIANRIMKTQHKLLNKA